MAKALGWRIRLTPLYAVAFDVDFIRRSYRQTSTPNASLRSIVTLVVRKSDTDAYTMLKTKGSKSLPNFLYYFQISDTKLNVNYLKIDCGILTMLPWNSVYHQLYSLCLIVHIAHINGHTDSLRLRILCRLGFTLVVTVVWASATPDKFPEWAEELYSARSDGFHFVRDNTLAFFVKNKKRKKNKNGPPKRKKARAGSRKQIAPRYGALVQSLIEAPVFLRRRNETVSILSVGTKGGRTDRNDANNDLPRSVTFNKKKKVLRPTTVQSILAKLFCPGCLDIHSFLVGMNGMNLSSRAQRTHLLYFIPILLLKSEMQASEQLVRPLTLSSVPLMSCEKKLLLIIDNLRGGGGLGETSGASGATLGINVVIVADNSAVAHRCWIKCYIAWLTKLSNNKFLKEKSIYVKIGRLFCGWPEFVSGQRLKHELTALNYERQVNVTTNSNELGAKGSCGTGKRSENRIFLCETWLYTCPITGMFTLYSPFSVYILRCKIYAFYQYLFKFNLSMNVLIIGGSAVERCNIKSDYSHAIDSCNMFLLYSACPIKEKHLAIARWGQEIILTNILGNFQRALYHFAYTSQKQKFLLTNSELLWNTSEVILQFYSSLLQNYVNNIISRLFILVLHVDPGKQLRLWQRSKDRKARAVDALRAALPREEARLSARRRGDAGFHRATTMRRYRA
ncbi:hypothetical protein ALC57_16520 [Trachymyrmex cornetzi]|uniref:Uncharacterized protein n=1 Tax=Trachymyrmex cornetzi TaxID=471704 RepID=A0A195DFR8_9HYME|nr:hypothetical protein ALC57_16520 [Trachymyrmex cornetzi]